MEEIAYGLGKFESHKLSLCIAFTPSIHPGDDSWQMQVMTRARGGKPAAVLLATTALRPLGTVTVKGETYPLVIRRHERLRGGTVSFGGDRKIGSAGDRLEWEMRFKPDASAAGRCQVEMRIQSTPRRTGDLQLALHFPLHQPEIWSLAAASLRGHAAQAVYSAYSRHAVRCTSTAEELGWNEERRSFEISARRFPFGGGKALRFTLGFGPAAAPSDARAALVGEYAALAGPELHQVTTLPAWNPAQAAAALSVREQYGARGAERLYLRLPLGESTRGETFFGGFPHFPLEALQALADWNRSHPQELTPSLIRYGACGIAADFQVMGGSEDAEPNKGAFWDKKAGTTSSDFCGGKTHGIASTARIARSLMLLHHATGEQLLRRAALNGCEWLLLKMSEAGYYGGDRVRATRGAPDDGRVFGSPCSLDGAAAIPAFVLAYRATRNEVYVKAAWKIARYLMETHLDDFECASSVEVASVLHALLALDREAPNARLRAAIVSWGAWLRTLPLSAESKSLNADGCHAGLYECAHAGLALFAFTRDPAYLRYALAARAAVPADSAEASWRDLALAPATVLALAALLPGAVVDFDGGTVTRDWRVFAPESSTERYVHVADPNGAPVWFLPLVCRANDQMLLLVLAPPSVEAVTVTKNGRHPALQNALTGEIGAEAALAPVAGEAWARAGIFTIDA